MNGTYTCKNGDCQPLVSNDDTCYVITEVSGAGTGTGTLRHVIVLPKEFAANEQAMRTFMIELFYGMEDLYEHVRKDLRINKSKMSFQKMLEQVFA